MAVEDARSDRGLLTRLRVPLLFAAACVIGFALQFGAGLPGTPVWAGVLAAEAAVFLGDRYLGRRPWMVAESRADDALPPDPSRRWTAELEWQERGAGACFRAVARSEAEVATVSRSRTFGWPPEGPDAVQQVTRAAGELETALLSAGWGPLPAGDTWYAKRFAWPLPEPAPDDVPARPATGSRAWPEEARALPRCEVRWSEGYRRSWFEVVVFAPGRRRSRVLASSDPFRWMLAAPPDPGDRDHLCAMVALCAALEDDGWEEVAPGPKWYSRRFVWRRPTPPPDRLGAETARS
jgi:hypothetical protein